MTLSRLLETYIEDDMYQVEKYLSKKFHNINGDACVGDVVWFARDNFSGSYKKPKYDGTECIRAIIVKDSYGKDKQQHTFTLEVMKSATSKTSQKGSSFRIKGRNLYKHFLFCENAERKERNEALEEKHKRGSIARAEREVRISVGY